MCLCVFYSRFTTGVTVFIANADADNLTFLIFLQNAQSKGLFSFKFHKDPVKKKNDLRGDTFVKTEM